ncbi:MAG TPA: chemotaxis-specific protein-glutamate methyltransferase CheB [Tepidisphaeraceae bacterium]|jgi:two-component system chemotaxis response regulator CheB|nr:chemotaxis-specific protein-glutamate methyltransferase CheB [Tepidisphaeraceae bacterium]
MHVQKIKVLVVEESSETRALLVDMLGADDRITVIGTAKNGREALEFLTRDVPDVILMDIEMSEMDGLETTRQIMETRPVPIVIYGDKDELCGPMTSFRLIESGAVAWMETPTGKQCRDLDAAAREMQQTVRLMSEVKVVRRWPNSRRKAVLAAQAAAAKPRQAVRAVEIVGIGASTGGPSVVQSILTNLPKDFPVPVLLVQHIAPGFVAGLVDWLNQTTGFKVDVANYGMQPEAGHVYVAPDDRHMAVGSDGKIVLSRSEPDGGMRPSVAHLFRSLAGVYGAAAVGVLLTGMGKDGAQELSQMKGRGALTIAQDRESSVVHGMAGEAIALGGASRVLPADLIAPALVEAVTVFAPQWRES